jgi:ribosomal protein S18 acetylase RimI-like enzyme
MNAFRGAIKLLIRTYKNSDKKQVISLWDEVFNYTSPHSRPDRSLSMKIKHNDGLLFVADEGKGHVVGTVMAGYDGHRGWIYSMAVKPGSREKGAGSRLLKRAVMELKKRGAVKVNLQIMPDNAAVVKFYEKNGFSVEPRISMGKKLVK